MDGDDVVHIDNGILLSHEKNKMPFEAIGMKLEIFILVKAENDKYRMWNLLFKNDINKVIYKTETDSQILKTTFWLPKRKYGGERQIRSLGLTYTHILLYMR